MNFLPKKILLFSLFTFMWLVDSTIACHTTPEGRPACPTLAVRGGDEIYVVYINKYPRDIFFTRSLDGGKSWSIPMNISDNLGDSVRPGIALDSEGTIYVAWGDNTDGKYDVFLRSSIDGGKNWSPIFNITAGLEGSDRLPSIATDSEGTIYVAWTNKNRRNENQKVIIEREVFLKYSLDGGSTWSVPYSVSRMPSLSSITRSDMTVDAADNLYILWEDAISGNFENYMTKGIKP